MKKNTTSLFMQLSNKRINDLTTIVKETLVAGFDETKNKVFSTADLWNIQRTKKAVARRRFSF